VLHQVGDSFDKLLLLCLLKCVI